MTANFASGTVWTGDNLDIMRGMNSSCVDLIYLDPPFNSNRTYEAPIGSKAAGAAFKDAWTLDDVDVHEHGELADRNPAAYSVIEAARQAHGKGMQSYLVFMAVRLLEMHRLLKSTGPIYLHCDPTASHYLKLLMDGIFGHENFRNEIIWKRTGSHGGAKRWGPVHDVLLFYSISNKYTWNKVFQEFSESYISDYYRFEDGRGRYRLVTLTGAGVRSGHSGQVWRNINPTTSGRHWAVPKAALERAFPHETNFHERTTQEKLEMLDEAGLIYWPKRGSVPQQKRYLDESSGVQIQDIIPDIRPIGAHAKERTGYPTQKPLALLERIILASSDPGDMVLDPFCGCATTLVAAERLGRQWVGMDIWDNAKTVVLQRLAREGLTEQDGERAGLFDEDVHFTAAPPVRTDDGETALRVRRLGS